MAYNNFSRYAWLIDTIQRNETMTFNEISEAWANAGEGINPTGEKLPLRTFNNHIRAIKQIFDIEIYYREMRWQINPQSWIKMSLLQQSLLAKLSLNYTIMEFDPLKGRILYEYDVEPDNDMLRTITRAMNKNLWLTITYSRFGKDPQRHTVAPYCLKMYNHRWYLLGKEAKQKDLRVFAMDGRMLEVEERPDGGTFKFPKDFDGNKYFDSAIGVIVNPGKTEPIRVKAFGQQADYWRSAPVHHSQKEIETGSDYAIFELRLNPNSLELEQLLFSKIDQIEVLSPKSLRDKMITNLEAMNSIYSCA